MSSDELEKRLLHLVKQPGYKPSKPGTIAKQLGLSEDEARDLKRAVKQLVKLGKLSYGANHLVGPPAAAPSGSGGAAGAPGYRVTGVFRRADAGFGFLRPAGSAPGADRTQDVFIAAKDSGDAATGDTCWCGSKRKPKRAAPIPRARSSR